MSTCRRVLLALALSLPLAGVVLGVEPPLGNGAKLSYREQLEKGLKCRRPVEFEFVGRVVDLVDAGVLPRSLVDSTFDWARKKRDKNVQYFEFALRTRAKKLGVDL